MSSVSAPNAKAALAVDILSPYLGGATLLDVGAGPQQPVRGAVGPDVRYIPVDRDPDRADVVVDLAVEPLPMADDSVDVVVCLDVLEHLDDPYEAAAELFRVARRAVLIGLPNPWGGFYEVLRSGRYRDSQPFKYYGLPASAPWNRHRWFFSTAEAQGFLRAAGARSGWVVAAEHEFSKHVRRTAVHPLRTLGEWLLFRRSGLVEQLYGGHAWTLFTPGETDAGSAP